MVKDINARHGRGDQVDLIRLLLGYSHFPLNTLRNNEDAESKVRAPAEDQRLERPLERLLQLRSRLGEGPD
ncbi:MAG TPA: hypothetical protein VK689_14665 [Armatimonadota bacterium]|nr:hypothetical protein [Armatimonadota bacterium]